MIWIHFASNLGGGLKMQNILDRGPQAIQMQGPYIQFGGLNGVQTYNHLKEGWICQTIELTYFM